MTLQDGAVIDVIRAEHVSGYRLRLLFSDGTERQVDFESFLRRTHNPLIQAYLDPAMFARFRIEDGNLVWDDYGLCFSNADLYENHI